MAEEKKEVAKGNFPAGHPATGKDLAGTPHPKKVKK